MPYTPAHAIISLPLSIAFRKKIPIMPILVGSISPDFPYLLALTTTYAPGHSAIGLYCLLPSLAILVLWYCWLEQPILDLLHLPQRSQPFNKTFYLMVPVGVLLGAYSHILWDATSHSLGTFVINSHFWNQTIFSLPLYKWNQYGSGLGGSIALLAWYGHTVFRNRYNPYRGYFKQGITIIAGNLIFFVILANVLHGSASIYEHLVRSAIGVLTGGAVGLCVYTVLIRY